MTPWPRDFTDGWDLKTKPLSAIMVRASKQPWYRRKICMSRIYVNNKTGTQHQTTPWINVLPQHCRVLLLCLLAFVPCCSCPCQVSLFHDNSWCRFVYLPTLALLGFTFFFMISYRIPSVESFWSPMASLHLSLPIILCLLFVDTLWCFIAEPRAWSMKWEQLC